MKQEENYFDSLLKKYKAGDVVILVIDDDLPEKDEDGIDIICPQNITGKADKTLIAKTNACS